MRDHWDEKGKRLLAASMALSLEAGSHTAIHQVTGMAMDTLQLGVAQLTGEAPLPRDRARRPGGGRKPITEIYPDLLPTLLKLVGEDTQGDSESPLLWTSLTHLADSLTAQDMPIRPMTVSRRIASDSTGEATIPIAINRSGIAPSKPKTFKNANRRWSWSIPRNKENIGNFKNNGRDYRPKGAPMEVQAHDFPDAVLGKAIPYGVYDPVSNTGWVNVGIDRGGYAWGRARIPRPPRS